MPESLTLFDGTILENSSAIQSGDLFIYVQGSDMQTVFNLLIDPDKVKKITYTQNNGGSVLYLGFKKLTAVTDEGDGLITAVLKKAVNE